MNDRNRFVDLLAHDGSLKPLTQLPEFQGWVNEKRERAEVLFWTLPCPAYGQESTAMPEVSRLIALQQAIGALHNFACRGPDEAKTLRQWLFDDPATRVANPSKRALLPENGYPATMSDSWNEIEALYKAHTHYVTALSQLHGPQKLIAEGALRQLDKAVQPVIDAKLDIIREGFVELKHREEANLEALGAFPDAPVWFRQSLETARDICDLAILHLDRKPVRLEAVIAKA
ncbi:MAG: hypothetical protein ACKVOE_07030 [Rickettsiales bacterium]